jgi:hypothetical protein
MKRNKCKVCIHRKVCVFLWEFTPDIESLKVFIRDIHPLDLEKTCEYYSLDIGTQVW